jgi:two-component system sensor histidine kinase MprB
VSLRWRLALVLASAVALAVAVASAAAWFSASERLTDGIDRQLLARISTVRPGEGFGEESGRLMRGRPFGPLVEPDSVVQVLDEAGEVILVGGEVALPVDNLDRAIAAGDEAALLRTVEVGTASYRMVTSPLARGGAVQLARDLTPTREALAGLRDRLLLIGVAGAALAALIGWAVARRTIRPVEALTEAAERVAATQDLDARIGVAGTDEVGRLASSFNTMLVALDGSRRQQQRLVSDAGHELRTPLTALRTNLEVLERRPALEPEQRRELVTAALSEVDELTALVGELVDLATDTARSDEPLVTTPLDDVLESVIDRSRRRTGREITLTGTGAPVTVRASQLERALGNLLDNAHKWSPDGAAIAVEVSGTSVRVRDHGPGIAAEDLPRVFDRFYRAASARTLPGSGLGLAIVRQVVEAHGGTVSAANAPGGGAIVGFSLPPAS